MLAARLQGAARNFYMSLTEYERRDFRALTSRLSDRFGNSSKHQCLWLNKLENRRRAKGESIASLADDLRQLAQKAYSDLDHRSQEKLALNQLYKLVSTEMKCRCMDHECITINEAVSVIERYESILENSSSTIRSVENTTNSDLDSTLKRIENRLTKIETASFGRGNLSRQPNRLCFGCNSPDHIWASCPQNTNPRARRNVKSTGMQRHGAQNSRNAQTAPSYQTHKDRSVPQCNNQTPGN
jgi:hypothetical protein